MDFEYMSVENLEKLLGFQNWYPVNKEDYDLVDYYVNERQMLKRN